MRILGAARIFGRRITQDKYISKRCAGLSLNVIYYDKVPEAINFRALAQKNQLKILESKDAISHRIIDMASLNPKAGKKIASHLPWAKVASWRQRSHSQS